jgi:hypothetical protein
MLLTLTENPMALSLRQLTLLLLLVLVSACTTGGSDAGRVLEADNRSLRATVSFYQSLDPTMTFQAGINTGQLSTLQVDLERSRQEVRALTIRLNNAAAGQRLTPTPLAAVAAVPPAGGAPVAPVVPVAPVSGGGGFSSIPTPTSFAPVSGSGGGVVGAAGNTGGGGPVTVTTAGGMSLANIVLARATDGNGCAVSAIYNFSTSDSQIYVVTEARNYAPGTTFTTTWSGVAEFKQVYTWTADEGAESLCVYFYVEPRALQMAPGSYAVVFSVNGPNGSTESQPITFTIQ